MIENPNAKTPKDCSYSYEIRNKFTGMKSASSSVNKPYKIIGPGCEGCKLTLSKTCGFSIEKGKYNSLSGVDIAVCNGDHVEVENG